MMDFFFSATCKMLALDSFLWQMSDREKEKHYNNLCFIGRAAAPGGDSCVSPSVENVIAEERMFHISCSAVGNRRVNICKELD